MTTNEILEQAKGSYDAFDMYWNYGPHDGVHLETEKHFIVICGQNSYSDRGGGVQRDCYIEVYDWGGNKLYSTEKYTYRHQSDPSMDDSSNYFEEVLSFNEDALSVKVQTSRGMTTISVSAD